MAVSSLRTQYGAPRQSLLSQEQLNAEDLNQARMSRPTGYGPFDPIAQGFTSAVEGFNSGDINQQALEQEQLGNVDAFSRLRRQAGRSQERASVYAPRVQDYRDVNSLGDAASYIGGGIGQGAASLVPITAAALPGALVGGPVGAVLSGAGAFAAGYGMNRGENVTNQYADPDVLRQSADERASAASMTAAGQSVLDTIVPGRIAHGLRGVAKSGLGRRAGNVLKDMATEGVTEGAQDVMGQYSLAAQGSQKPFDQEQAVNSAILGAVGAGPISGAGNVAGSVADKAVDAGLAGAGLARDAAGKVKQTMQEKVVPAVQGATAKAKKSDVWKDVAASAQAAYDGAKTVGAAAMESPIFGEVLQAGQAALKNAAGYVAPAKITETADRAADFLKNTDMADIKSYASDVFADRFSALVGNAGVDETQDPAVLSGAVPNTPEGLNLRKVKLNDIYTAAAMSVLDGSGGQEYTDADRARAQALTESRTFTPSDELWLANSVGRPLLAKQLTAMKDSAVAYVADRLTSRPATTKRSNRQGSALEARPLITAVGTLFGRDAAKAPEYAAHLIEVSQDLGSFDPHYVSKLATKLAVSDPKGTIIQALRASGGNELADTMERELSIGAQGEVMRGEAPMLTQSAKDGDKLERAELLGIAGYIDRNAQSFERAPDNTKLRMLTPLIPIYGAENARALLTHYAGVKRGELQAQQDAAQQGAGGILNTLGQMYDEETAQGLVEDYQRLGTGKPGPLLDAFIARVGDMDEAGNVMAMFKDLKNDPTLKAAAEDRGPSATDQRYGNMAPKLSTSQRFAPGEANDSNYEDAPNEIELSEQGINEEDVRNLKPGYRWPKTVTPFYSGNERDMAFMAEDAAAAGPDARVATMEEYASAANLDPGFLYKRVRADVRRRLREAKKTDRAAIEAQIEYLRDIQDMGVDLDPDQEQDLYDLEDALDDPNLSNDAGPGIAMLTEQLQLLNSKKEKALASFNVVMRPEEETRASDDQLEKYAELLNKATAKTRDAIDATKIVFRTARGTDKSNKLVLSAESMMYASPGKGSIADRLFEAIKSVLARPDIISMDTPSPDMVVRRAKADGDENGLTRPAVTWKDVNVAARFETKKQYAAPDAAAMKKQKDRDDSIRKTITNDIEASDAPIERALELLKSYDTQIAENRDARETAKDNAALKQLNMRAASLGSRRRVVTKILEDQLDAVLPMPERDAISASYAEEAAADGRYADENETTQEMLTTERMILEERLDMVAGTSYARVVEKELGKLAGRERAFDDTKALTYEVDTGLKRGAEKVGSDADRARLQRRESPRTAELRTWAAKMLSEYATTATAERKEEISKRIAGWLRALRSDLKELRGKKEPTKEDLAAMLIADDQMSYGAMTAARIEAVRTGAIPAPTTAAELAAFGSIDPLGPVQRPAVKTDAVMEKKALSPAETKLRALSMEELDRRIAEYGNVPKRKLRVGDRAEMTVLQAEKERRIPTPAQILASGVDEGRRLANAQVPVTTERFRTLSDKALEESIAEYDQEDFTDMYALLDERARRAESKARAAGPQKAAPTNARGAGPYIVNPKRAAQKREVVIAPERRTVPRERREAADRAKAMKAASDEEKTSDAAQNKQGNTSTGTEATNSELQAEADRLLGKGPILLLNKLLKDLGGGGEFKRDANGRETISVALNAMGRMGIMRHEALHAFFARLGGNAVKLKQDLTDVASNPRIMAELTKLLSKPGDEQALAQIQEGAPEYLEERLAYMYQFWAEGLLDITPKGRNIFQKIQDFFRNLAGVVAKHEKAERILTLFHSGEFANPTLVDAKIADNRIETASDKLERIAPAFTKSMEKVFTAGTDRLRNSGAPAVAALADKFEKFLQERAQAGSSWQNRLNGLMAGKTKAELTAAMENFQAMRDPKTDFEKAIAKFLSDMHDYQTAKKVMRSEWIPGVDDEPGYVDWQPMRKIEKNYFPRSFDGTTIEKNRAEWDKLLTEFVPNAADRRAITENFIKGDGREEVAENEHQLGFTPWSKAVASRKLRFITEDNAYRFAKFENKDFVDTLSTYVQQAVHRAEYAEMFGNNGEVIQQAFNASNLGIDKLKELTGVTRGLEGTLGHDMNKSTKELFTGMMLMQNAVLLPLAIFSQMVDPLMIAARSGKLADAGKAYVQAFKSLVLKKGDDQKLAEWLGTVSDETVMQAMGNTHGSMHMSRRMRNFSRQFFKWNGMQGWNSAMRTAATVAGEKYLIDNKDNAEALKELGLKVGDVKTDASGKRLDIGKPDSALGKALFQFVDESVIRPNAAHRPTWMSDPRFMLLAHLKQFTFSMHKVVLERAADQAEKGNYHPMKMLALATPVMLAADMAKWSLTGKTPESWTYLDYLSHAVMRSGVLGKWQFGADALGDSERGKVPGTSFLGPTAEHLMLLMRYLTGGVGAEDVIDRTIPGARYVRNSFVGRVSDPMGAGNAERQLRKDGVDKTYDSTGWFKGPDGKMRKEIDPKKVTAALWSAVDWNDASRFGGMVAPLSKIADKIPEFAKYKDKFKGVNVFIGDPDRENGEVGGGGYFSASDRTLMVYAHVDSPRAMMRQIVATRLLGMDAGAKREALDGVKRLPEEARLDALWDNMRLGDVKGAAQDFIEDTFVHELQHAIQDVEGFEGGADPKTALVAAALGPKAVGRARRFLAEGNYRAFTEILDTAEERFINELVRGSRGATIDEIGNKAHTEYAKTTGEVEAFDVTARKGMTSALRRKTRPALMDSSREFLRSVFPTNRL